MRHIDVTGDVLPIELPTKRVESQPSLNFRFLLSLRLTAARLVILLAANTVSNKPNTKYIAAALTKLEKKRIAYWDTTMMKSLLRRLAECCSPLLILYNMFMFLFSLSDVFFHVACEELRSRRHYDTSLSQMRMAGMMASLLLATMVWGITSGVDMFEFWNASLHSTKSHHHTEIIDSSFAFLWVF